MKNHNILKEIYQRLFSAFGPQHWWPGDTPFEIVAGAILTQNTNWGNVEKAITNLKNAGALSAKRIHAMSFAQLSYLIVPAGYFNVKAVRLKSFVSFLMVNYQGSMKRMKTDNVNSLRERLLCVHGIGPETADSILLYALEEPVFVIDAYTKRVLSRHGIMEGNRSYNEFQEFFHASLQRDVGLYNEYHALFVKVAKTHCRTRPDCGACPLFGLL
jgi:endonuclease-3 related protein